MMPRGGRGWRWLGPFDLEPMVEALAELEWKPSKGDAYAMIDQVPGIFLTEEVERICAMFPGRRRGMMCLSRLVPGQYIEPHFDYHDSRCQHRVHIPITSNSNCWMAVGDEVFHLEPGHAYEFNPSFRHWVLNGGHTDRVHLFWNMTQ